MQQQRIGYGLTITAAVSWAMTSPGIRYLLDIYQVPALTLAFWRDVFGAGVLLLILALFQPALLRVDWRALTSFALGGAITIGFYHALWVTSVMLNGAAVAIVLIYTFPMFVTLGGWLFFGERPGPIQFVALAISLLGCALLVRVYDPAVLRLSWIGALVGLASALSHTGYVLFNQRMVAHYHYNSWTSLAYMLLFGTLALALTQTPVQAIHPGNGPGAWVGLALLGAGPMLIGYGLFTASLRYIPARTASLLVMLEVPTAVLIAVLWLGEHLEWLQIVGMGCILLAVLLPALGQIRGSTSIEPAASALPSISDR